MKINQSLFQHWLVNTLVVVRITQVILVVALLLKIYTFVNIQQVGNEISSLTVAVIDNTALVLTFLKVFFVWICLCVQI